MMWTPPTVPVAEQAVISEQEKESIKAFWPSERTSLISRNSFLMLSIAKAEKAGKLDRKTATRLLDKAQVNFIRVNNAMISRQKATVAEEADMQREMDVIALQFLCLTSR